jgi:di/tripeptidase
LSTAWPQIHDELEARYGVTIEPRESADLRVSTCDPNSTIYQVMQQVFPGKLAVFSAGSTDQSAFTRYGISMLMHGPGDATRAHTRGDRVSISAIRDCRVNIGEVIKEFSVFQKVS